LAALLPAMAALLPALAALLPASAALPPTFVAVLLSNSGGGVVKLPVVPSGAVLAPADSAQARISHDGPYTVRYLSNLRLPGLLHKS
jgi:hypothetical protein